MARYTKAFWLDTRERVISTAIQTVLGSVVLGTPVAITSSSKDALLGALAAVALMSLFTFLKCILAAAQGEGTPSFGDKGMSVEDHAVAAKEEPTGELVSGPALEDVPEGTPVEVVPESDLDRLS